MTAPHINFVKLNEILKLICFRVDVNPTISLSMCFSVCVGFAFMPTYESGLSAKCNEALLIFMYELVNSVSLYARVNACVGIKIFIFKSQENKSQWFSKQQKPKRTP